MGYAAAADALMRLKLIESISDRMTPDERRLLAQLTMQDKSNTEIMQALQQQTAKIDKLQETQQTFAEDFLSNIAGNAAFDGLVWLARRIFR